MSVVVRPAVAAVLKAPSWVEVSVPNCVVVSPDSALDENAPTCVVVSNGRSVVVSAATWVEFNTAICVAAKAATSVVVRTAITVVVNPATWEVVNDSIIEDMFYRPRSGRAGGLDTECDTYMTLLLGQNRAAAVAGAILGASSGILLLGRLGQEKVNEVLTSVGKKVVVEKKFGMAFGVPIG